MSSTAKKPRPKCQYFTRPDLAEALVCVLDVKPDALCLEPHVGQGAFVRALQRRGCRSADGCEIDLGLCMEARHLLNIHVNRVDFLAYAGTSQGLDLILGNPPYSRDSGRFRADGTPMQEPCAELHIRHALSLLAPGGQLAFLLRLAFLESADRVAFWREHPAREVWVLAQRPSFTGGETDSSAYGWFIWERGWKPSEEGAVVGTVKLLDWKGEVSR